MPKIEAPTAPAMIVAVVTAFFMFAVPSAATASFVLFEHTSGYPFKYLGVQKGNHTIKIESLPIECKKASYSGTLLSGSSLLNVQPKYESCFSKSEATAASIEVKKGCELVFSNGEKLAIKEGCELKIAIPSKECEVTIKGRQGPFGRVLYEDQEKPTKIELVNAVEGILYEDNNATRCETKSTKGSNATYTGAVLVEGVNTNEVGFQVEKGWSAEGSGAEFVVNEAAKVTCEKDKFEGVSPASGFADKADFSPKYSGCKLEILQEETNQSTSATVAADGCDYQLDNGEEPEKNKYKTEFDISKCSGGGKSGILALAEVELGKTCEILIPGQSTGKEDDKSDDTKETPPYESETNLNATAKSESTGCPLAVEDGKEPTGFLSSLVRQVGVFLRGLISDIF